MKDREYLRSSLKLLFQRFGMVNLIAAAKYLHSMDGDFRRAAADYDDEYDMWPVGAKNFAAKLDTEINQLRDELEENGIYDEAGKVPPETEYCRVAFKAFFERYGLDKFRDAERYLYDTDGEFRNLCDSTNDPDSWSKAVNSRIEDLERQLEAKNKRCDELEKQNDELEGNAETVSELNEDMDTLRKRIGDLEARLRSIIESAKNGFEN